MHQSGPRRVRAVDEAAKLQRNETRNSTPNSKRQAHGGSRARHRGGECFCGRAVTCAVTCADYFHATRLWDVETTTFVVRVTTCNCEVVHACNIARASEPIDDGRHSRLHS
ncbi:hypothetical protein EVAR_79975_1 [Eumeta japonica]|uniref:Uncharacterized protein n=1 Tax=Eumeta variegata TaxID=151549 RepID=A0A4C2AAM3_EUMVA|nr:hypothetical protein EVAR_79975_1 [Eumeta japonica]